MEKIFMIAGQKGPKGDKGDKGDPGLDGNGAGTNLSITYKIGQRIYKNESGSEQLIILSINSSIEGEIVLQSTITSNPLKAYISRLLTNDFIYIIPNNEEIELITNNVKLFFNIVIFQM